MNCVIKNGEMTYTISTTGAELISAKNSRGEEFIWQANAEYWGNHAPLLFPVCGRLKNFYYVYEGKKYELGIHGFLRFLEFDVIEADDSHVVMTVSENAETLKQYPFNFNVTVSFKAEKCKLLSSYVVKNNSAKVMPYAFGLHPGFNLFDGYGLDDYKVVFDKSVFLERTELEKYPNGPEFLPIEVEGGVFYPKSEVIKRIDTIVLKNVGTHSRLICDKSGHEIEMSFSENLPLYCIWKNSSADARYVCLEPWTTEPARHVEEEHLSTRENMRFLKPAESERFLCDFTFKK